MKRLLQWAGVPALSGLRLFETALCLIDFQKEYSQGKLPLSNLQQACENATKLLAAAESAGISVVQVRHLSTQRQSPLFNQGSSGAELMEGFHPKEGQALVTKHLPSSFAGTDLHDLLQRQGIKTVIFAGLATHMCLSATVQPALTLGYRCLVASDACADRALPACDGGPALSAEEMHRASLAALADRFAQVEPTNQLVQWIMTATE